MSSIGQTLSNIFRPTQQVTQAPQQQPQQPPVPGSSMQVQNPAAGAVPPDGNQPQVSNPQLDGFKALWETDPKATPPQDPWSQPILPSDPAKIQQAARGMNMLQGVDQQLVQKVQAGGDPQALMDLMNAVAQNTLAMATQLTTASVERAGTVIRDRQNQQLPDKIKDFQLTNLPANNPVLDHPSVQPLLQLTRQQIRMTQPGLSAEQVNAKAVEYLTGVTSAMQQTQPNAPGNQPKTDQFGQKEEDWGSFLS